MYTEENIKNLYSEIEEIFGKVHLKSKVRDFYQNRIIGESEFSEKDEEGISILYKQIINSVEKKEKFVEFLQKVKIKDLTRSQIFYKYFLENEELNDENIKYVFSYFVEIEVNKLLKENVYKTKKFNEGNKYRVKNIFNYDKLKNLVVYKL